MKNNNKTIILVQLLIVTTIFGCHKDYPEYVTNVDSSTPLPKGTSMNNYKPDEAIEAKFDENKTKGVNHHNNKVDEPRCTHLYDLKKKDLRCPDYGENCCDPVVITSSALIAFRAAVDGGEADIADFFNNTSNWESVFPFLSNSYWESYLIKLQSGDYDMEEEYDSGLGTYGYIAQNSNGDYFVLRIIEG